MEILTTALLAGGLGIVLGIAGTSFRNYAARKNATGQPEISPEETRELMESRAKHLMSVMIVGAIIFLACIAILGVVDIKDATVSALVIQLINTLKDMYRGPSAFYYNTQLDDRSPAMRSRTTDRTAVKKDAEETRE